MSPIPPTPGSPELLLEQAGWIRRLARQLVNDPTRADDLAQETWVRMLSHPPAGERPVRGWIATVMRNLWRAQQRGEARRTARERAVAHGGSVDTDDLAERVASHRDVAAAVLALDEPYRSTIVMRYLEGQSPKRIAARQGIPVSTVKTRLARGLERLRHRLDREYGGDRRAWLAALLPLTRPRSGHPWWTGSSIPLGAFTVNSKVLLCAAAAVTVAGASILVFASQDTVPAEAAGTSAAAPGAVRAPAEQPASAIAATPERRVVAAPDPIDEPVEPAPVLVRGRVIDLSGTAVAGVAVAVEGALDHNGVTEADGRFALEVEKAKGDLIVVDTRYATVLGGSPVRAEASESVVVVAPRIELAGRVIDEFGAPIAGARIEVRPPADLRAQLGTVLDYSAGRKWRIEAEPDGSFAFDEVPALPGGQLVAHHSDFMARSDPAPVADAGDLVLVLKREDAAGFVRGTVVDTSGAPVEGALVSMGIDTTTSDAAGAFEFPLGKPQSFNQLASRFLEVDAALLIAVKPGYLPGELRTTDTDDDGVPVWEHPLVLRLGSDPLPIAGHVVDPQGEPLAGIRVWIADPTFFGGLGDPASGRFPRLTHVESVLAGHDPGWNWVESDDHGAFRIEGLTERDYVVHAMDSETLLRTELRGVRGGQTAVRVVMEHDRVYPTLKGRVVDSMGIGVAGVAIRPVCDAFRSMYRGRPVGTQHHGRAGVTTDESGAFELENVPRDLVYLRLDGADIVPLEWGRHIAGGLAGLVGHAELQLEVPVGRRCHFQVQLDNPDEADQIAVLDAQDEQLEVSEFLGNGRREAPRHPLRGGRSGAMGVSDLGRTLVLYKDEVEVRRIPLQLKPGERIVVR